MKNTHLFLSTHRLVKLFSYTTAVLCITALPALTSFGQAPGITSFSPITGSPGTAVTITGFGFNTTVGNNIVFLGATKAVVTSASATSLSVTVPSEATFAPITVLNSGTGLTAYSSKNFTPVFTPLIDSLTSLGFADESDISTPNTGSGRGTINIIDIDGDGKADELVTAFDHDVIEIFRNTSTAGTISFAAEMDIAGGQGPANLAVGDVDGDGKPDIVALDFNTHKVFILRNTSTPGNISFAAPVIGSIGAFAEWISINDIDGDGKPDITVANYDDNNLSILRNTSTPGNVSFAAKMNIPTDAEPKGMVAGDIDGDGKPDIALTSDGTGNVDVFRNTSTPGNISFVKQVLTGIPQPGDIRIADMDGDGKNDLVCSYVNTDGGGACLIRNTGSAGNIQFAPYQYFQMGNGPVSVTVGDISGDGKPDIGMVSGDYYTGTYYSLRQNTSVPGNFSFEPKIDIVIPYGIPTAATFADLDGDNRADLLWTNSAATISFIRNSPVFLTNLTISKGTLSPAFNNFTTNYTVSVSGSAKSLTVTPTLLYSYSTATVDGVAVTSGAASQNIPLKFGNNTISVAVTQAGKIKTYNIIVNRPPAPDATLTGIGITGGGSLSPAFNANQTFYTDTVDNDTTTVQVTPVAANAHAIIKVNGVIVPSGTASAAIPLPKVGLGENRVNIEVNAGNGDSTRYIVMVTRLSQNAKLANLAVNNGSLSPAFSSNIDAYTDTVHLINNYPQRINVTPTASNMHAQIKINGAVVKSGTPSNDIPIHTGENIIQLYAIAQNGSVHHYHINVVCPFISNNAHLSSITTNEGPIEPAFKRRYRRYTVNVSDSTSSIKIRPTVENPNATITVDRRHVASGAPTRDIPLSVGQNDILIVVTAQNTARHRNYFITVVRADSTMTGNARLPAIADNITKKQTSTSIAVTIYPNPASSTFNLKIMNGDNLRKVSLKVRDMQGNVVYQSTGNAGDTFTFGQNFAFGVYSAEVVNGSFVKQVKVIKSL